VKTVNATGVSFKPAGKIYDFLTNNVKSEKGDHVIVETEKGEDIAVVIVPDRQIKVENIADMKNLLRKGTKEDISRMNSNKEEEPKAFVECKKLIVKHELDMKLLKAEYTLDKSKLTFFFTADGRIDFRQLVRDLARVFRTRIEMRQVGVRDATKMLGGFGICGKEFCCSTFLRRFDNISIKMAKDQNLILNPAKISGVCGRLMCCLMFEKGFYDDQAEDAEEVMEFKDIVDKNTGGQI
jgi:cell fate regulator YaaT (PSP1 superfamily)